MSLGVFFVLRVRTPNPLNGSGYGSRFALSGMRRQHRGDAAMQTRRALMLAKLSARDVIPATVTMRRLSTGRLDPHDALPASLKSVVDGVADALGVDDGGPFVTWRFENKKCARGHFGVEIEIERRG
jgi:hypothetical protein